MRARLRSNGSLSFANNKGEWVTMQSGDVRDDIPICIWESNREWLEELPLAEIRQTTQLKAKRAYRRGLDTR
jgi:hypothetical protein